jgi:hypothetical protein
VVKKINDNAKMPKFRLSTYTATTVKTYASGNMKKVFLKPVENSNGLFENGVGILKVKLVWKENKAKIIEHNINAMASKMKRLYISIETKGTPIIKFSQIRMVVVVLSPNVKSKKSVLFFSDSLN